MLVKQIDLQEALKLAAGGHEIKVMAPTVPEPEKWTDYKTDLLQHILEGCLFFRSEPAMERPKFEETVQEMAKSAAAEPDQISADNTTKPSGKRTSTKGKRKPMDVGKLQALRKAGWSTTKIADEMGVSPQTILNHLNKQKEGPDEKTNGDGQAG